MTADETTIAEIIRDGIERFSPREKRAAHVLLANYPMCGLETVAEFARRAGVSAPTILRFVSRLGFAGYAEFQRALKDELEKQTQSPLLKARFGDADAVGTPMQRFRDALVENVSETFRHLPAAEFAGAVTLLADPRRRIHAIGGRLTDALARSFSAHLRIVRSGVLHLDGQTAAWRDQMLDFGPRDVLVVFDIRRYQEDVAALAEAAAGQGGSIVLMTDQWLSPVARHARHIFAARVGAPSQWDSHVGLLGLSEALVAAVVERRWEEASRRLARLEAMRTDVSS